MPAPGDALSDKDGGKGGGTRLGGAAENRTLRKNSRRPVHRPDLNERTCSDAARRPMGHRIILWKKRFRNANNGDALFAQYVAAKRACELSDWRSESTFLRLLQAQISTPSDAHRVLSAFSHSPDVQRFIARLILRRTVNTALVATVDDVIFGSAVNWNLIDLELMAINDVDKRIDRLRQAMSKAPEDPKGTIRLVRLLAQSGKVNEALVQGRRLKDRGLMTPLIARQLGAVLAAHGQDAEAVRTYSEIVEFDATNLDSRKLLADLYLSHGWYEPAYRQYRTMTDSKDPASITLLKLAQAAAGTGRIDEALRIERKVASAPGNPGPNDPRRWARLSAAARLARMLDNPPKDVGVKASKIKDQLTRKLKELQLFRGAGQLVLLTWEDLDTDLALNTTVGGKNVLLGESVDGAQVGIAALLLPDGALDNAELSAQVRRADSEHTVKIRRHVVGWDGKTFSVAISTVELAPQSTQLQL
jgi:tetratricopeptide (TPR) repeat protein